MCRGIKDALYDAQVFDYFKMALKNVKKTSSKPSAAAASGVEGDTKNAVEEFDAMLELIKRAVDGEEVVDVDDLIEQTKVLSIASTAKPTKRPKAASRTPAKSKKPIAKRSKRSEASAAESDEDEVENDKDSSNRTIGSSKARGRAVASKTPVKSRSASIDDDESVEDEEEAVF